MTIRYDRPFSWSAYWARRVALLAIFVFFAAGLTHRFGSLSTPTLLAFLLLAALLALLAIILGFWGLLALWKNGAQGGTASVTAILLSLIPIAPMAFAIPYYLLKPAIRDITTDIGQPPPFLSETVVDQGWLPAQRPTTAKDRAAQGLAYREISGRRYEGAIDRVLNAVLKVGDKTAIIITDEKGSGSLPLVLEPQTRLGAQGPTTGESIPVPTARPGSEVARPGGEVILQGHVRSTVFGFYSDVIIRLREEPETTLVDMRVASRFGKHDLGAGDRFIQRYFKALDAELLGIAGD